MNEQTIRAVRGLIDGKRYQDAAALLESLLDDVTDEVRDIRVDLARSWGESMRSAAAITVLRPLTDSPIPFPPALDIAARLAFDLGDFRTSIQMRAKLAGLRRADADQQISAVLWLANQAVTNRVQAATVSAILPQPRALISVVICSIRPERLATARVSLVEAFGDWPWELIHIPDATSLCEGYNRGAERARGDLIVFCHDDIRLLCRNLGDRLTQSLQTADVVGVAGSDLLAGPTWYISGNLHGNVCHEVVNQSSLTAYSLDRGQINGLQALDGVFIATRREVFARLKFDAQTFDAFHFYDLDFTYRAFRLGLNVCVRTDILLAHFSGGRIDDSWIAASEKFIRKFGMPTPPLPDRVSGGSVMTKDLETARDVIELITAWLEEM